MNSETSETNQIDLCLDSAEISRANFVRALFTPVLASVIRIVRILFIIHLKFDQTL